MKLSLVLRQYNVLCTQVWDLEIITTCMHGLNYNTQNIMSANWIFHL